MNFEARKLDSPNTVEGYFSIFKRGVVGTYHHVSEQHLDRYLAEFDFRYNNRLDLGVSDPARSKKLLKGIVGRRLTYRSLTLPRSPSQNARKFLRWRKRQS